jgi:energy-coupling factor transporter ATP-binding protein EcfA2
MTLHSGKHTPVVDPKPEEQESTDPAHADLFGATITSTINRFGKIGLYLSSLLALLTGLTKLREPIESLFGSKDPKLVLSVAAIPLGVLLFADAVPAWIARLRERRLRYWGVHGAIKDPGYFRITPYDDNPRDRDSYSRADNAHLDILDWIRQPREPLLYLTGRSGAGKSSLLNAFVLPTLRESAPKVRTVTIRSFDDPIHSLRQTLTEPGFLWRQPPQDELSIIELLRRAGERLRQDKMLIVFDQFEEFLLIQDRNHERVTVVERFLSCWANEKITGVTILLVLRTDYVGQLQQLNLPSMRQNQNWKEIAPFTESAARAFLRASGYNIGLAVIDNLLRQAIEIEETKGLVRPVTLNMIGIVLSRTTLPETVGLRKNKRVGSMLTDYVRDCVNLRELGTHGRTILRHMITASGTKRPRMVRDLSKETSLEKNTITGCLLLLADQGLVRRIDERDGMWEVSHDFVARLLVHVLGNWRNALSYTLRTWVPVLSIAVWALLFVFLVPQVQSLRRAAQISDIYSTFDALDKTATTNNHVLHLYQSPENYRRVADLVKQGAVNLDKEHQATYLLEERAFADRVFNLFEQTLYEWNEAKRSHDTKGAEFLEKVLDYLTGRLLRNPRLLYFWSPSGGNMSIDYEEQTRAYYDQHVLQDRTHPLKEKPDFQGPFFKSVSDSGQK